ncbi:MAG: hypothetical protein ABI444_01410 [Candidatus Kapaibacterium sp.]|jgi:hypothetical protein
MNAISKIFTAASIVIVLVCSASTLEAMPNFARKYGLACSSCHTTIPRLNEFGFKFRAAGFRPPDDIGKADSLFNIGDYIAVNVIGQASHSVSTPPGAASTTTTSMGLGEVGFHPITGALTKDLSSDVQITFAPGSGVEIENAYGRYNSGSENSHFSVRIGVMHPFEGYGASDEPMGLSRPLFQESSADHAGPTLFTPWGFNQFGAEVGYTYNRSSIRASVLSGIYYSAADNAANPASGGAFVKPPGGPSSNSVDLQLFATQILTEEGGGISGYLYLGQTDLPTGITAPDSALYQNSFARYAIYASYPIQRATILAGFQQGTDNTWNNTSWSKGDNFKSQGWFAEADYIPIDLFGFGARYDQFQPSTTKTDNKLSAIAGFLSYAFGNGLQVVAEYQSLTTQVGPGQEQHDGNIGLNLIWIH